jgi:hypothetical protein
MAGPDIAGPGIAGPGSTGLGITGTVLGRMSAWAGVMPSESPAPVAAVAARNMRRSNGCLKAVGWAGFRGDMADDAPRLRIIRTLRPL